ncbi:MAG: response regulator transcription factor [Rhodospirillales bacterium]|nr:response regulator transcription factor [Rhodospirillales bacterium]
MLDGSKRPVDVVIADKNPLVRNGLGALFEGDERFRLVATLTDGKDFIDAVGRLTFDIGIIGWDMPTVHGRNILRTLRELNDAPRVVVYTGNQGPDIPRQVIQLGGAGFCPKREPLERIVDTVLMVAEGNMVFPFTDLSVQDADPYGSMTARERELLASIAEGQTNAQIARNLRISLNTVKFHIKNLYTKLEVHNRAQAVAWYYKSEEDA